ncbi:MAG: transcriptional regulator, TetR family [Chlorobi bacterium]|nr:transcriptional regulator, TetR family [Chlorobiota bacterium]
MQYYLQVLNLSSQALAPKSGLQGLPRRERARLLRRGEIIDAGRHVFARKGYTSTTLDDVADAAEMAKATLYSYFDNKESLFESVLEDSFSTMKAIGREALAGDGTFEERIRMLIAALLDFFFRNPSSLRLMMSESHQLRGRNPMLHLMPQLLNLMAAEIAIEQQRGHIIPNADPLDLAGILINTMYGRVMSRIYGTIRASMEPGARSVSDECVADAFREMTDEKVEERVMGATELIFTVFFSGIRAVKS